MDPKTSTTRWWRWPVYVSAAVVLVVVAISSSLHSTSQEPSLESGLGPSLSLNASKALRKAGFSGMASLLWVSPEYYSSASPNITIFALSDSALANVSRTPWLMKDFLRYHAMPLRFTMADLKREAEGSCLPTLSHGESLMVKKGEAERNRVEINDVPVTNPDLFLEKRVAIHGIFKPFAFLALQGVGRTSVLMPLPRCDSNAKKKQESRDTEPIKKVGWAVAFRFLNSHGFTSFAVQLKSVVDLDSDLEYGNDLTFFTIFAPQEFGYIPSETPVPDKFVKAHILPGKYDYTKLLGLPGKSSPETLVPGLNLVVTRQKVSSFIAGVAVNGLDITEPDAFVSKEFIIHGIPRAFDVEGTHTPKPRFRK